jgi:outer membrane immunogenic protein
MRNFILAGIVGGTMMAGAVPAHAADMPLKAPPPPPAVCDWCGFYAGVNIGADWGRSTISPYQDLLFPPFGSTVPGIGIVLVPGQFATLPATSGHATSVIGGGQAGYNWLNGPFLFGLEGDIDGTGLRMNSASMLSRTFIAGTQTVTANFSANIDWMATARGRIGYAGDHGLLYATGGVAVAGTRLNTAYNVVDPAPPLLVPAPLSASDSRVLAGWTVGAGGEWMFNKNWSGALEYRHSDFGNHGYNIGISDAVLAGLTPPGNAAVHLTTDQVTARLNYHFH